MARKTSVVAVAAAPAVPTRLTVEADVNAGTQKVTYYNKSASTDLWIGDSSVTVGNGIRIRPEEVATEVLPQGTQAFGIASAGIDVVVDQVM